MSQNQIKTKMKKIKLFLALTFLMFITASVASPIDNGEKNTAIQCSKEYGVVDNINNVIEDTKLESVKEDFARIRTCTRRVSYSDGGTYIQNTCYLESNGTYTRETSLMGGDGSILTQNTSSGLSTCSCN